MDWSFARLSKADRKALIVAELRKRAAARETITYGEMGKLVGLAPQGPWKALLDEIGADERAEGRPDLACLVVSAATGLPSYVEASEGERQAALAERERVFAVHGKDRH